MHYVFSLCDSTLYTMDKRSADMNLIRPNINLSNPRNMTKSNDRHNLAEKKEGKKTNDYKQYHQWHEQQLVHQSSFRVESATTGYIPTLR